MVRSTSGTEAFCCLRISGIPSSYVTSSIRDGGEAVAVLSVGDGNILLGRMDFTTLIDWDLFQLSFAVRGQHTSQLHGEKLSAYETATHPNKRQTH